MTVALFDSTGRSYGERRFEHDFFEREDGLGHCKVCGGAEGSLPSLCPERRLTDAEQQSIYAGRLDFHSGPMGGPKWWLLEEPLFDHNSRAEVEAMAGSVIWASILVMGCPESDVSFDQAEHFFQLRAENERRC